MSIDLKQLRKLSYVEKLVIHSVYCNIYQASVIVDGEEHYVVDNKGNPLRHHNIAGLQALFEPFPIGKRVLRHQSAYDEMVGQPARQQENTLEVSLCKTSFGDAPKQIH